MFSIRDIIALAVKMEENGEAVYRAALSKVHDAATRDLLKWLAEEEKRHARWFATLKETLEKEEDPHILEEMRRSLASDFFADQTFSLQDVDFSQVQSLEALIEIAIDFEKDGILFYEMLAPFVTSGSASKILGRIIEEENAHIRKLQGLLQKRDS